MNAKRARELVNEHKRIKDEMPPGSEERLLPGQQRARGAGRKYGESVVAEIHNKIADNVIDESITYQYTTYKSHTILSYLAGMQETIEAVLKEEGYQCLFEIKDTGNENIELTVFVEW